jgi:hypothetical protein
VSSDLPGLPSQPPANGRAAIGARGFEKPVPECPELEEIEQPLDLLEIPSPQTGLVPGYLEREVPHQRGDGGVPAHLGLRQREALAKLGSQVVEVGIDPVDVPVCVDEFGRGLLADARHAGQVVRGVPAKRGVLRVDGRVDTGTLHDPRLVVERVIRYAAAVVQDPDVRILDQLVGIPVPCDDDDVVARRCRLGRERGDHVVGLVSG